MEELESEIQKRIISMQPLKSVIQYERNKISPQITTKKKLVQSMPKRLTVVLKAKGNPTKY